MLAIQNLVREVFRELFGTGDEETVFVAIYRAVALPAAVAIVGGLTAVLSDANTGTGAVVAALAILRFVGGRLPEYD